MKRFLFTAILVIIALVLLVVAGAGIFLATLDLGRYRTQLATLAEDALGRAVIIEGEVGHSIFPLGLSIERVVVKNAPEFGSADFLSVENVALRVDLAQLLTGAISIDEISVGKAAANLVVSKSGKKNWEFAIDKAGDGLANAERGPALKDDPPTQPGAQPGDKKALQLAIRNVSVDNTVVSYTDLITDAEMDVQLEKVAFSNIAAGIDMPVRLAGMGTDHKTGRTLKFSLGSAVRLEDGGNVLLRIEELQASLGRTGSSEPLDVRVQGEVVYASKLQSVNLNDISGNMAGIDFDGMLAIILPGGQNLKKGQDLDVRGELHAGNISDKHVAAITKAMEGSKGPAVVSANQKSSNAAAQKAKKDSKKTDFSALKPLFVKVDVNIDSFSREALRLENIVASVTMDGGAVSVPYAFDFYGGTVSGSAHAGLASSPVSWKVETKTSGVQMEPLLDSITNTSDVSGVLSANANLTGTGMDPEVVKSTAQGTFSFELKDSLVKADFPEAVKTILDVRNGIPVARADGLFAVKGGLATIQRLEAVSSLATVQGKGHINLLKETLEVMLEIQPGGVPPSIPLVVDGPLRKPVFNLHASRILEDTARQVINDPLGSVQRVIDKREELKESHKTAKENLKDLGKELEGVGKDIEGLFKKKK